jgi:hypothetical protein
MSGVKSSPALTLAEPEIAAMVRASLNNDAIVMLTRLSQSGRLLAGRLLALVYLACVLAPGTAFAFGNARMAEHCLFDEGPAVTVSHDHAAGAALQHAGHVHHQHGDQAGATHDHSQHAQHVKQTAPAQPQSGDPSMQLQCCGMLCISALPVALREVATPGLTHAFVVSENGRHLADSVPPRHYRPPIT